MKRVRVGVIGCGLMGGSFALAMKRAGIVRRVIGYSKSPSTTEKAKKLGIIDQAAESALLAVSGSDIVLIAVPVAATEATFKAIRHLIEPGVLLMDAIAFTILAQLLVRHEGPQSTLAKAMGRPQDGGVLVNEVQPDSPAAAMRPM